MLQPPTDDHGITRPGDVFDHRAGHLDEVLIVEALGGGEGLLGQVCVFFGWKILHPGAKIRYSPGAGHGGAL